jgi:hypothetical protein
MFLKQRKLLKAILFFLFLIEPRSVVVKFLKGRQIIEPSGERCSAKGLDPGSNPGEAI